MRKCIVVLLVGMSFVFSACSQNAEKTVVVTEVENTEEEWEENKQQTEKSEEIAKQEEKQSTLKEMLYKWEGTFESIFLEDMLSALNQEKVIFTARYNKSGERVDLELEDGTTMIFLKVRDSDMNELGHKLIMKDGVLDAGGFQEQYLNCYDVICYDYYAPGLSEQLIDENWLNDRNQTDLSIMRNELFAKYGREFSDPFLREIFALKEWYNPIYSPQEFEALGQDVFTEIEKQNLAFILEYERNAGYRKESGDTAVEVIPVLSGAWFDLDGNGTMEQVYYQIEKKTEYDEIVAVTLSVDAGMEEAKEKVQVKREGVNLHDTCYVFSIDGKTKYLVLGDYGPSSDNEMFIYEYVNGELREAGHICDDPTAVKVYADRIEAAERYDHICSQYITFTYMLRNGTFVKQEKSFYEYKHYGELTAICEFALHNEKDIAGEAIIVKPDEKIEMIGGDLKEWILLRKVATGEEGWLYVKESKCMLLDESMVYSAQVLDGLTFFD